MDVLLRTLVYYVGGVSLYDLAPAARQRVRVQQAVAPSEPQQPCACALILEHAGELPLQLGVGVAAQPELSRRWLHVDEMTGGRAPPRVLLSRALRRRRVHAPPVVYGSFWDFPGRRPQMRPGTAPLARPTGPAAGDSGGAGKGKDAKGGKGGKVSNWLGIGKLRAGFEGGSGVGCDGCY